MTNLLAALALGFGTQQLAWTILDFQGLQQYGEAGWPYDLNPLLGGVLAFVVAFFGVFCLDRHLAVSHWAAIVLSLFVGLHFWFTRHPAEPYRDYGEENFARMFLNLILLVVIMLPIAILEHLRQKRGTTSRTDRSR